MRTSGTKCTMKSVCLAIALAMALGLASCSKDKAADGGQQVSVVLSRSGESASGGGNNGSSATLPAGLEFYVAQYPFLANLAYPDGGSITEFDDSDYEDDKVIYFTVESMDSGKLDAYLQKANATNLADDEMAFLLHSEDEPLIIIDYSSLSFGRIDLEVYDYSGVVGSVTISDATMSGHELPAVALKYVGTLDTAYSDSDKVFFVKAKNASYGAFAALVDYYAANGGTLDEATSTSSGKNFDFPWGRIEASHFGLAAEITIQIVLN